MASVSKLEYMLACLNEAMRMLPAIPTGLPRVVPEGGRVLNGKFVPQGVSLSLRLSVLPSASSKPCAVGLTTSI